MFFRAITEIPSLIFTIFYVIFEITEIPSAIYLITQFNLQKFVASSPGKPAPERSTTDASFQNNLLYHIFSVAQQNSLH